TGWIAGSGAALAAAAGVPSVAARDSASLVQAVQARARITPRMALKSSADRRRGRAARSRDVDCMESSPSLCCDMVIEYRSTACPQHNRRRVARDSPGRLPPVARPRKLLESARMRRAQQLGRYHLFDRIAFGGMAEIYRAKTFDSG